MEEMERSGCFILTALKKTSFISDIFCRSAKVCCVTTSGAQFALLAHFINSCSGCLTVINPKGASGVFDLGASGCAQRPLNHDEFPDVLRRY